jgi:dUTP pyrophosphatase
MEIKVKKLIPEAVVPTRAHASDAGFDLVAVSRVIDEDSAVVYGTGLAFEIPEGYVGLVFPRSSVAKKDMVLSNCVGVIDSGYRGEVMAKFKLIDPLIVHEKYHWYEIGERICQIVFMKLPEVELVESDELSESDRGTGGYGSTGK